MIDFFGISFNLFFISLCLRSNVVVLDHDKNPCKNEKDHFQKSFTTKKKHLQVTTSFFLWQLQGMYFWMKTSRVYTFLCGYLPISRTYSVCMYLAWRNLGNLIHIYVNKINAQTGKRSCLANSPWRVFPKRQRISEENYITCAVDTAVVTVFVEVEDEWKDVSGLLAIWGMWNTKQFTHLLILSTHLIKCLDCIGIEWIASLTARETALAIARQSFTISPILKQSNLY